MGTVRLRKGRVQAVWSGHPWVFAQAIARVEGAPALGDPVRVVDPDGRFLGAGFWTPDSAIPVRLLSRDPDERIDEAAIARRIDRAAAFRRDFVHRPSPGETGYRLVHAEGDSLPGLIVDVYGDVAVAQILTAGMKRFEDAVFAHVARVTGAKTVVRAATNPRGEGFVNEQEVVRGPEVSSLRFFERGFEFSLPTSLSQKTGYYFDQRDNRARVESLAHGRVLDAYAYVGAMGLAAARGGADEVVCLDSSAPAVAAGAAIAQHNGLGDRITFRREDVKKALPRMAQRGERFDVVIVDPPKLAASRRHLDRARRAYERLNELATKLLVDGGILITCSCSAAMRPSDFVRSVNAGIRRAGRWGTLLAYGAQAPDHPTPAAFPEGRYLKAMFLRVDR